MRDTSIVRATRKRQGLTGSLSAIALALLAVCLPAIVAQASSLAHETSVLARALAQRTPWSQPRQGAAVHPLGVQTLFVERQENKQDPDLLRVSVYQFNYQLEQARVLSVDAGIYRVLKNQPISSVHLPLSNEEISFSRQLLSTENDILNRLREEQSNRGHPAFTDLSILDVKASIFEPMDTTHPCHRQRCALMSLFDDTQTVFSVEPVINLQTMQVSLLKR